MPDTSSTTDNDLTLVARVLKIIAAAVQANGQIDLSSYATTDNVNTAVGNGVTEAKAYTDTTNTATTTAYKKYVDDAITALKGVAPATLDTIKELADALQDNPNEIQTILTQLGTKADTSALTAATTIDDTDLKTWLTTEAASTPAATTTAGN